MSIFFVAVSLDRLRKSVRNQSLMDEVRTHGMERTHGRSMWQPDHHTSNEQGAQTRHRGDSDHSDASSESNPRSAMIDSFSFRFESLPADMVTGGSLCLVIILAGLSGTMVLLCVIFFCAFACP